MKFSLKYRQGIIEVKTFGDAEVQVFKEFVEAIVNHVNWEPGGRFLVDLSELDIGSLTVDQIEVLARIFEQNREKFGHAKCALLVSRDLEFGMGRMWQVFVEKRWSVTE